MKKNKLISVFMSLILVATNMQGIVNSSEKVFAADLSLKNPLIQSDDYLEAKQKVTWDCIYFGTYPQAEVISEVEQSGMCGKTYEAHGDYIIDSDLYSKLKNNTGWINNIVTINGVKYKRIKKSDATNSSMTSPAHRDENYVAGFYNWSDENTYHYFEYEPIKWRVLKVDGNKALVLADKCLDSRAYNESRKNITWEKSTIRSWLNGYGKYYNDDQINYSTNSFIDSAFTTEEKQIIQNTSLINEGYKSFSGNNTTDKIFFLSFPEIYSNDGEQYGFKMQYNLRDEAKKSYSSTYAKAMGVYSEFIDLDKGYCFWWLRSPGNRETDASYIADTGKINEFGFYVDDNTLGIRPVMYINIADLSEKIYANTVNSKQNPIEHKYKYISNNDATCLIDGTKTEICKYCGEVGNVVEDEESALGHSIKNYISNNDATCTSDGTKTGKCSRCDYTETITDKGSALGHSVLSYTSNKDATCTSDGTKSGKCTRCEYIKTVIDRGSALGHSVLNYTSNKDATCINDGTKSGVCSRCGIKQTIKDEGTKLGHSFINYISNNDATCTSDGTKTAKCDRCSETNTITDIGTAKGHCEMVDEEIPATCTKTGLTEGSHCEECGVVITKQMVIPKLGHSFTNYISNNDATCTSDGTKTAKCDRCSETDTITDIGTAKGHCEIIDEEIPATCIKTGLTEGSHCKDCGLVITKQNVIPKLGHSFTRYISNDDATCTIDGTKTAKCDRCDVEDTEIDYGSAKGHSFIKYISNNDATCTSDGTKTAKCSRCDVTNTITDVGSALGHKKIIDSRVESTCSAEGLTEGAHCSRCKEIFIKQEIIPKKGHKTIVKNERKATIFENGYTGDKICTECNSVISKGHIIKKITLGKPKFKVKTKKKKVKIIIDYNIASKFVIRYKQGKKWKIKTISKKTFTISKLNNKQKVIIKIQAFVTEGKKKAYSGFVKKSFKVK